MDSFFYVIIGSCIMYICFRVGCIDRNLIISTSTTTNMSTNVSTTDNVINRSDIEDAVESYEMKEGEIIICPITQDEISNGEIVNELPCGHLFSNDIAKWINIKNICPVCREKIINLV